MTSIGRSVFERAAMLDSGPLISLYDPNDNRRTIVVDKFNTLQIKKIPVFITVITIAETHKRILYDIGYDEAVSFLDNIFSGDVNIIDIIDIDLSEATSIIRKYSDQEISFADASTMAVMKRVGIKNVLSFDRHFWVLNFTVMV